MNTITITNRRSFHKKKSEIVPVFDVTSKSSTEFIELSPFYPLGNIPVPFSDGFYSKSVEGIWQGLKVFTNVDVDVKKFEIESMKGLKRTVKKYGTPLGHRKGVHGDELLNYVEARKLIYVPTYEWTLHNKNKHLLIRLAQAVQETDIILLDYETNADINNIKKPLSHAALIKAFIEMHLDALQA